MAANWEIKQPLHHHLNGSKICQIWRRVKLALKLQKSNKHPALRNTFFKAELTPLD